MSLILVFIFGLVIGSFLNAVIFRLDSGESALKGRSHCMHCWHDLKVLDLIPVLSFVFLRGRCRYCSKKISWQYCFVELLTAAIFVLLVISFWHHQDIEMLFFAAVTCFLIVIGVFDFKHYLILDRVLAWMLIVVILYNLFFSSLLAGLLGGMVISGFFAVQYYVSAGRWIGFGDVKFGFVLGNIFGIKLGLIMLLLAYFLGAIVGVTLLALRRKSLASKMPFGVFLSLASIIMMLYGQQVSGWYLSLIGF